MRRKYPLPERQCVTCKENFVPKKTTSKNCNTVCMSVYNRNKILARTQERRDRISRKLDATPQGLKSLEAKLVAVRKKKEDAEKKIEASKKKIEALRKKLK